MKSSKKIVHTVNYDNASQKLRHIVYGVIQVCLFFVNDDGVFLNYIQAETLGCSDGVVCTLAASTVPAWPPSSSPSTLVTTLAAPLAEVVSATCPPRQMRFSAR